MKWSLGKALTHLPHPLILDQTGVIHRIRGQHTSSSERSRLGLLLQVCFPTLAVGRVQDPERTAAHPEHTIKAAYGPGWNFWGPNTESSRVRK